MLVGYMGENQEFRQQTLKKKKTFSMEKEDQQGTI